MPAGQRLESESRSGAGAPPAVPVAPGGAEPSEAGRRSAIQPANVTASNPSGCTVLASVGYHLGSGDRRVLKAFSYAGYVAAALVVIALVVLMRHRFRVVRSERAG